jgi:hypothetical protein
MTEEEQFALNELADDHPVLLELTKLRSENARLRQSIGLWIRSSEALGQAGAAKMMRDALEGKGT